MNSNLAWARLLVREHLPTIARAQALERIEKNTLTQLALVDEVFDLALVASGQRHLELTAVDLTRIAIAAVETFSATAAENGVALRLHGHDAPRVVLADRRHVTQLLDRLLRHVLRDATSDDCVDVTLTKEATHEIVRVAMATSAASIHIHRLLDPAQALPPTPVRVSSRARRRFERARECPRLDCAAAGSRGRPPSGDSRGPRGTFPL